MADPAKTPLFKKILFAVWALATVILCFTVVLLAEELVRQGKNPMTMPEILPDVPARSVQEAAPVETREIPLYFASADGRLLVGETRRLPYSERTVENCRTALEGLIKGPITPLQALFPPSVEIRSMFLLDSGELVVDFSLPLQMETRKSVSEECLLVYSVVDTLTQASLTGSEGGAVRSVRFLIGGLPPTDAYPAHIDISAPVTPDPQWLLTSEGGRSGDA